MDTCLICHGWMTGSPYEVECFVCQDRSDRWRNADRIGKLRAGALVATAWAKMNAVTRVAATFAEAEERLKEVAA